MLLHCFDVVYCYGTCRSFVVGGLLLEDLKKGLNLEAVNKVHLLEQKAIHQTMPARF